MHIAIYTLGCPKNFNDSQIAAGLLEAAGHTVTLLNDDSGRVVLEEESTGCTCGQGMEPEALEPQDLEGVDAILVNTCGFIQDAKTESINAIFEMSRLGKLLLVSGCLSQRYGEELYKEIPEVDIFVGVNEYENLPHILESYTGQRQLVVSKEVKDPDARARKLTPGQYTATIKISEGCNNHCTFCAIPGIRGAYRSRPMDSILEEAQRLVDNGMKELVLIAEDTSTYGIDLYSSYVLPTLLEKLCAIQGIQWIRIMYCYEDRITPELVEVMAREEKICAYLDIPLQHIADNVLKRMGRRSTTASIRQNVATLRQRIPHMHIRTTLIVGFPGETEEDFQQLLDFVEEAAFDRLGAFTYSAEEDTPAALMPDQIPEEVKEERYDRLMSLQLEISRRHNQEKVGQILEILVEGQEEDGSYVGRSRYDAPEIDCSVAFTSERDLMPGDLVQVEITDGFEYDLLGVEV